MYFAHKNGPEHENTKRAIVHKIPSVIKILESQTSEGLEMSDALGQQRSFTETVKL